MYSKPFENLIRVPKFVKSSEPKTLDFQHIRAFPSRKVCGSESHEGKYLLVPNTPVETCLNCGMVYYDAVVLKEIERHFFAIHSKAEEPDCYIEVPAKALA